MYLYIIYVLCTYIKMVNKSSPHQVILQFSLLINNYFQGIFHMYVFPQTYTGE